MSHAASPKHAAKRPRTTTPVRTATRIRGVPHPADTDDTFSLSDAQAAAVLDKRQRPAAEPLDVDATEDDRRA